MFHRNCWPEKAENKIDLICYNLVMVLSYPLHIYVMWLYFIRKFFSGNYLLLFNTDIYVLLSFYYLQPVQIRCRRPEYQYLFSKWSQESNRPYPMSLSLLELTPEQNNKPYFHKPLIKSLICTPSIMVEMVKLHVFKGNSWPEKSWNGNRHIFLWFGYNIKLATLYILGDWPLSIFFFRITNLQFF